MREIRLKFTDESKLSLDDLHRVGNFREDIFYLVEGANRGSMGGVDVLDDYCAPITVCVKRKSDLRQMSIDIQKLIFQSCLSELVEVA